VEHPREEARGERADAEARPVGAEQSGTRVQVVGDVDRQRILDRPIEEEEQPGQDDQTEQVGPARESESRVGSPGVERLLGRRNRRVRAPGLNAEEGE
jgi:hypothetical protein